MGMPLKDGTLPHHDSASCTKVVHQHKVSISTVVALVTAPVHKGVINDAGIAFNPIAGAPRARTSSRAREAMAEQSVNE